MAGAGQAGCGPMTGKLDCYRFVSPISTDALVLTEPIKSNPGWGASFKRRSGKFAANPSVLDYLRMPVAKEKPRLCRTCSLPLYQFARDRFLCGVLAKDRGKRTARLRIAES